MKATEATDVTIVYARGKFDGLLLCLLFISLATNVFLGHRLLRTARIATPPAPPKPVSPPIGKALPPLDVHRLDGAAERVRYGGPDRRSTVIYVFAPSCPWCRRNAGNVKTLSEVARSRGIRLIGLSLEPGAASYAAAQGLEFPVYENPENTTVRAYGLGITPQTFVIDPDGTLKKVWTGAFAGGLKQEVEAWLGKQLPGLSEKPREAAAAGAAS